MFKGTARCACGALQASVEGDPIVVACNCTECQRRTGSVFGVTAYFPRTQVKVSGPSKLFIRGTDSGRKLANRFCPNCGTTVILEPENRPDDLGVTVGCFADPAFPKPARVVWARHKHHWIQFPDDIPTLEAGRPSPS